MNGGRLLIVEDDALAARGLVAMLGELGHEIVGLEADAEAAIARAREVAPDLVLMDVGLRGLGDGIEAAARMRREAGPAVVFMMDDTGETNMRRALDVDPFGIMAKPVSAPILRAVVSMALRRVELERSRGEEERARRAKEDQLLESEARLESLVNNVNEYIYSVDYREGRPTQRYDSPKCLDITGYGPADFAEDEGLWLRIIHEEDRPKVLDYVRKIEAGETARPIEHRILRKDGKIAWVLNSYAVLRNEGGKLRRSEGFILDMGDRIAMERELVAAKEAAEAANHAKSEFLASMTHELRTPLNSILGFSQLLAMKESGSLSDKQRAYIEDIRASGEHLLGMIGDILDISKIEAGKIEIVRKPFDLGAAILTIADTMKSQADRKRLSIELDVPRDLGALDADEVRVRQILYNLLSNAVKFTPEGRRIGIVARGMGDRVTIEVWDEGIGIAEKDRQRIFEPFEQVRRSDGVNLGSGLGLAITARLTELHRGSIRLESEPGRGSRFFVELPGRVPERRSRPEAPEPLARRLHPEKRTTRILVVEDNPVNRKLMEAMLDACGQKVSFAVSGEEAVAIARAREFDLVFMDINLPGIDGIEAMKRIKAEAGESAGGDRRRKEASTAFIALTAHAMKGDAERFIAEGMDEVVTKPVEMERLVEVLGRFAEADHAAAPDKGDTAGETANSGISAPPEASPARKVGVDARRGLLLLGGDQALYDEMLDLFAETYVSFADELDGTLAQGSMAEARRVIHGLKGASSNLGLTEVAESARILEGRLAAGELVATNDSGIMALARTIHDTLEWIRENASANSRNGAENSA